MHGISTAYNLVNQGKTVAVLDRDLIASHTSGGNTGKVTSQHGLIYKYLYESNGKEYVRKYFEANEEAIKNIEEIIQKENIECDFEKRDSYVFTEQGIKMDNIKQEVEYAKKIGINAKLITEIDLPINIVGGIKFENQAQFNPVKYVLGLVNSIISKGGKIFENSKVIDIEEKNDRMTLHPWGVLFGKRKRGEGNGSRPGKDRPHAEDRPGTAGRYFEDGGGRPLLYRHIPAGHGHGGAAEPGEP